MTEVHKPISIVYIIREIPNQVIEDWLEKATNEGDHLMASICLRALEGSPINRRAFAQYIRDYYEVNVEGGIEAVMAKWKKSN